LKDLRILTKINGLVVNVSNFRLKLNLDDEFYMKIKKLFYMAARYPKV